LFGLEPESHDFAVIEAGINQPGEMAALGQMIRADLNILTNIGDAHLELLGSRENIAVEKSLLAVHAANNSPIILPAEVLSYPAYAALADRAIILKEANQAMPDPEPRAVVNYTLKEDADQGHSLEIGGRRYRIASPSRGMATNAALAIVAAQQLGIAEDAIQARIEAWSPIGDRGRRVELGSQMFYIDCYNANPSSMTDALDAFIRSAEPAKPRLFILGAMNELGALAEDRHRSVGARLSLRPEDRVVFVGPPELTEAYAAGASAAGIDSSQVRSVENIQKIKSTVASFEGAIFLKGSRRYHLEACLPESLRT